MALVAETLDITAYDGAKFYKKYELRKDDGSLFDLTGYKAHMQARDTPESSVVLLTLSTEAITKDGDLVLGAALGTLEMSADVTAMTALGWKNATFDVFIYTTVEDGEILVEGKLNVLKANTRV